jgi:hypothetical protein
MLLEFGMDRRCYRVDVLWNSDAIAIRTPQSTIHNPQFASRDPQLVWLLLSDPE